MRYVGIKGKFWTVFSEYIRKRDFYKYASCISCGQWVGDWHEIDAGHFIAASSCGFALLFDESNVNGECKYDNGFNENHQVLYAEGLDKRYGEGTAATLRRRYEDCHFRGQTTKEWGKKEYQQKIQEYKEKIRLLDHEYNPAAIT